MWSKMNFRYIKKPSLINILAALIILWLNAGMYSFVQRIIPGIFMYGIFMIWFICVIKNDMFITKFIKWTTTIIPSFILLFIMYIFHNSSLTKSYIMFFVYLVIISAISIYYQFDNDGRKILYKVWLFDVFAVVFNTFLKIKSNPLVIRNMSANASVFESLFGGKLYGVASFSNILCYIVIMLFLYSKIMNKRKNFNKGDLIGCIVLLLLILKSQIAILIAFALIGLGLITLVSFFKDIRKLLVFFFLITLLFVGIYKYIPGMLSYISTIEVLPELLRVKALDVAWIISGSSNKLMDATIRMQQYENDIKCFIANPLLGTLGDSTNIGGHSTWIDLLGMYGISSMIVMIWHFGIMKRIVKSVANEDKIMVTIIVIIFSIIGIIDPIFFQNVYMVFIFVIPYISWQSK